MTWSISGPAVAIEPNYAVRVPGMSRTFSSPSLAWCAGAIIASFGSIGSAHAASLYSTKCGDISGTTSSTPADVALEVEIGEATTSVDPDERREHVRISQGLADELGIDSNDVSTSDPAVQVRVTLDNIVADSTAIFTVAEIDAMDAGLRLDVWLPDDVDGSGNFTDEDNGFFKLYGSSNPNTVFASSPEATVHFAAPGTTVQVSGGVATEYVNFTEPNSGNNYFRECVELHDDELAVIVPHGGSIEVKISDQLPSLLTALDGLGQDPSVWEATGRWSSGTFNRWHITSTQLSLDSFPGLDTLAAAGPYKYTLSLHGYSGSTKGVVVGGRASRQVKCYLVQQLEAARVEPDTVFYKIYGPDGGPVEVNGSLGDKSGIAGQNVDNIVNRLSSNNAGAGGIQLEMSSGLRNDADVFSDFMEALAEGTDDLVDLGLVAEPGTDYCALIEWDP